MVKRLKPWWPLLKLVLAVGILIAVGWQFARILLNPSLQETDPQGRPPLQIFQDTLLDAYPGWLVACGVLYIVGLCFSLAFWIHLLHALGQQPLVTAATRAYFIGHLGKYVPGKAWALLMRTTLVHSPHVRLSAAALTAAYETLTTMASGALVAAVLLAWRASTDRSLLWQALGLLVLAGLPIVPGVFNPIVRRLTAPFRKADQAHLPPVRNVTLLGGLAMTAVGWVLLGLSLWAVLRALHPEAEPPLYECIAFLAVAYVAGFVAAPAPGGLGVREAVLQFLLAPTVGPAISVVAVLLLRLVWTLAEVIVAVAVWWLPHASAPAKVESA